MTIRDELEAIGFALAAGGVAFAGTLAALFTIIPFGFYPIATTIAGPLWAAALPAAFVAVFGWALRRHPSARLHPIPMAVAAFAGGMLSFAAFQPLGLTSILFLPALVEYPAALLAGFALDRPRLSPGAVGMHAAGSVVLYSVFAVPQLAIAFRWIDIRGCDGCDPTQALPAALLLYALGLSVVVGAALRVRLLRDRARGSRLPGESSR